jgi:alpha-tubulin suppressor-like RCC1 family protein
MRKIFVTLICFLLLSLVAGCGGSSGSGGDKEPVDLPSSEVTAISAGYGHTIALKSDSTLWAWGRNSYGQLGDGTTEDNNTPVQIGTDSDWTSASA